LGAIEGITRGLAENAIEPAEVVLLPHAKAVATNALLEHKSARTIGLVWMAAVRRVIFSARPAYRAYPLGPMGCQHSSAASSIHKVRLPRLHRPTSSASQIRTLNDTSG
jgi:hypothetical protein